MIVVQLELETVVVVFGRAPVFFEARAGFPRRGRTRRRATETPAILDIFNLQMG
jgi:hypothetical protein